MNVIIGTRGSKLALAQAEYVKKRLQKHYPQNSYELKIISTKGDREQKKALDQIGDKGLFVPGKLNRNCWMERSALQYTV